MDDSEQPQTDLLYISPKHKIVFLGTCEGMIFFSAKQAFLCSLNVHNLFFGSCNVYKFFGTSMFEGYIKITHTPLKS